ncbi:tetratricopeptide repeat protein [bacterium]|nr:tetratricopeptide repeat protein [bacterium]
MSVKNTFVLVLAVLLLCVGCVLKTNNFYAPPLPPRDIPSSLIGKDAGDFTIEWLQGGSSTQLSSYENKKVVAFRVWSFWCERCQKELPVLQQVYDKYKDKGFVLIALFPDESRGAIRKFMADKDYTFPIGFNSEGKVAGLYKIDAYPALIFIDKRGMIEKIRTGFISDLKETLENGADRLVKNEPFPASKEWAFQADTQKEKQTYAEKQYQAQRALLHNADQDEHVEEFLDLAAKNRFKTFPRVTDRDIIQAGKKLIDDGCSDPLVLSYYGLQLAHAYRFDEARTVYEKSAQALEKSDYSKSIKHIACLWLAETLIEMGEKYDKARNHLEYCIASILALYNMDDEYIFFYLKQIAKAYDKIGKEEESKAWRDIVAIVMNEKDAGSWLLTMCRVNAHIRYAWDARGGGWASTVTDDGWRIFKKELRIAEEEAHKAYQMYPERPQAFMLTIGTGLGYSDEWKARWFQRVIKTDFDYPPAYSVRLWYLQSRWGGSHEERMAFGKECLSTKRFDTFAPLIMIDVLEDAAERMTEDAWRMWMRAETWETVKAVFEGYLAKYPNDYWIRSRFVNFAVKCMQFERAAEELAELGDLCYPRAFEEDDAKNEAFELAKAKIIAATSEGGETFREALRYELKNEFDLAEENYKKALSLAKSEEARNAISRKLAAIPMMKKYGASEEALMDNTDGYHRRGGKYKDKKEYDKAIKEYQKAIALPPRNSKTYHSLAICYDRKRNRNKEIEFYKKTIEAKHDHALAWNNLGKTYWEVKRYDEGIKACKEAIRIRPNYTSARFNLALIYQTLKRYDEAIASYKEAIRIDPDCTNAHHGLGWIYNKFGQHDKAVKTFKKVIEAHKKEKKIRSDHSKAYHTLGSSYSSLGQYNKAVDAYKEAIRIKPNIKVVHYNLGLAYNNLEQYDKAIEAYKEEIRLNPNYASAHYNLGLIYYRLKRYDKMIESNKKAIRIEPNNAKACCMLGLAYYNLERYDIAIDIYKKAIRINPDIVETYVNLGLIYAKLNQHNKAIEVYNKALQIKSDYAVIYYNLACSYSLLNDIDKAVKAIEKALALGYDNFGHMSQDSDFDNLRKDPRYKGLITKSLFQKK